MQRSFLVGFIIYLFILAGLVTMRGDWLALALPFIAYLLLGLWRAPGELRLEVHRTISVERAIAGTPITVAVAITNLGNTIEELLLEDNLSPAINIHDGSPRHLLTLASGRTHTFHYTFTAPRGYYNFSGIRAASGDPLGLVRCEVFIETHGHVFVLPPVVRLNRITIRPRQTRVYSGSIPARAGGSGVEFYGVREYQAGDSTHTINWNVTARHQQSMFSNEYQQERVADVGIILDGRIRSNVYREHSLFEHSVAAAAALVDTFLTAGNRVGLLLYSQYLSWTFPGYGKIQRERILQALARAEVGDSQVFSDLMYLPARLFPAHSQLVLVSPVIETDLEVLVRLRARGYQIILVSPDPVSFEQSLLPRTREVELAARILRLERATLLKKLQHAGIQTVDWDITQPIDSMIKSTLRRPPAWVRAMR
jgi:uncharacterized protein (DUF58 family)